MFSYSCTTNICLLDIKTVIAALIISLLYKLVLRAKAHSQSVEHVPDICVCPCAAGHAGKRAQFGGLAYRSCGIGA